ncbi:NUDIX hydrolase [Geothermobacter hydrogeniphilus]|uniref:Nudix hydrolase domain-containing protein n=1 Tax=Geothermobacter hydrogeniphilus TaxID=1969733 RepID=A0A1X0Y5T3_9BACT|nr:CoA pyrophosphatase [Geothermobacter hydrogeniphilus]ORJ60479.1 hypothetical protein B5V00_07910 [Geothermobacter hydrogeniphilus]
MLITLEEIRRVLADYEPQLAAAGSKQRAAVALLLHQCRDGLQIFFIERASHPRDPWSGNLAFPGGRVDPEDADEQAAAERETREEVGLQLKRDWCIGRLDDIHGAYLPIQVACFVYRIPVMPQLSPNEEVTDCFWFPCDDLLDPSRHGEISLHWQGRLRTARAIDLLGPGRPVLWGITYRLVTQLLVLLGCWDRERLQIMDD